MSTLTGSSITTPAARPAPNRLLRRTARAVADALGLRLGPAAFTRLEVEEPHLTLTYLGTAGFVLEHESRTLVLDPYLSRASLVGTLMRPLRVDEALGARLVPRADDVLIGHAHHDHILDAPAICRRTGARLIGSRSTCMVGRAAGVPERQLIETAGREDIACGSLRVRGIPSLHGKAVGGRVPLPGDIHAPPPWPPRLHQLRHGQVLDWFVDTGSLRIVHVDSADFLPRELEGLSADVLCLCAVGRRHRPGYVDEILSRLEPRWVIPCHWDTMTTPIDADPWLLPGVDLPGFVEEIRRAGATPLLTPILGRQAFPALR
jgi:L-ascorbate metabolism protein UlaG (beta-lactamase superfamily)